MSSLATRHRPNKHDSYCYWQVYAEQIQIENKHFTALKASSLKSQPSQSREIMRTRCCRQCVIGQYAEQCREAWSDNNEFINESNQLMLCLQYSTMCNIRPIYVAKLL